MSQLKPLHTSAAFTFSNGEVVEDVALWSFTSPPDPQSGVSAGKGIYKPISITKPIDESSEKLSAAMKQGQRLRTVVITADRLQYTLTGVFIREIAQRPGRIEEVAMECELIKQQHLLGVPTRVLFTKPF
jgi:type VI protein secretion system component Hcp